MSFVVAKVRRCKNGEPCRMLTMHSAPSVMSRLVVWFLVHHHDYPVERYNTVDRVDGEEAIGKLDTHFAERK